MGARDVVRRPDQIGRGSSHQTSAFPPALVVCAIVFVGALVWGRTVSFDFTMDDPGVVVENEQVERFDIAGIVTSTLRDGSKVEVEYNDKDFLYRPVPKLTFALNQLVSGDRPWSYHLGNVLLHILAAVLVWPLMRRLRAPLPLVAGAVTFFLLHPVHTESVANVKNREEILAAIFVLTAWLASERAWDVPPGARRWGWACLGAVSFLIALLSKESAMSFLGILPLADLAFFSREERPWSSRMRVYLPFVADSFVWLGMRTAVIGLAATRGVEVFFTADEGLLTRLLTSSKVLASYYFLDGLVLLRYPISFSSRCEVLLERGWPSLPALAGLAILLISLAFAFHSWRRGRREAAFWVLFFWLAVLPTSNLLVPIGSVGAFRFLYLPSLAWGVLVGAGLLWLARRFLGEKRGLAVFWAVLASAALVWSVASIRESENWRNDEAVNRSDLMRTSNPRARYLEAQTFSDPVERERWLGELVRMMERVPGSAKGMETTLLAKSYLELAEIALERDQLAEAEKLETKSLAVLDIDTRYRKYRVFPLAVRARLAALRGDAATEIKSWEECVQDDPLFPDAYLALARILERQGDRTRAAAALDAGIRTLLESGYEDLRERARVLQAERARILGTSRP